MSPRFASVFTHDLLPVHRGKEVGLIPLGLQEHGWDVELHAPSGGGEGWPFPVHIASLEDLSSPSYWSGRGLDAALVYSFFRHERVMAAVRRSGGEVVVKGDTDGLLVARRHPRLTLEIALHHAGSPLGRALQVAHWAARLGPLHRAEATRIVRAVAAADAVTVESDRARERIAALLAREGAAELADRLHVVPSPVAPAFSAGRVDGPRARLVVAAGRWDDGQKNARLMWRALRRFLDVHPGWRACVVGAAARRRFSGPGIEAVERLPQEQIASLLRGARIVASSSRYESFSLAVHEGLASGCSIAATPLAPFETVVSRGPYGTLAARRGTAGLADALAREAAAWEAGERDPARIAEHWRGALRVGAVAARYDALLRAGRATTSS